MWENLLYILAGGTMSILGYGIKGYIDHLKWKKQTRLDYWKEKRDELQKMLKPTFVDGLVTGNYSTETLSDMLTSMSFELLLIYNKYNELAEDKPFSEEHKMKIMAEMATVIRTEKERCDKEIELI